MTSASEPGIAQAAQPLGNGLPPQSSGGIDRGMRRRPEIFVAAAFAAGFLLARLVARIGRPDEE